MLNIEHQLNGLLHHYFKNKELDELYISVALKSLAISFIQIFIPIYLYKAGFDISEIALYYLVYFLSVSLLEPFCMKLISVVGIKKVMSIGTFVLAIYYMLLNYLADINYLIIALTFGISVALYYSAFHIEFSRSSDHNKEASEMSMLRTIINGATTLGPLIGAIFVSEISFSILFIVVSSLLVLSIVPLFFSEDRKIPTPKISLKNIFSSDRKEKAVAYWASGVMNIASGIFWPLFIFITLDKIFSVGLIISLTSVFMIFFMLIIGKITDKNKKKVLKAGIFTHSLSWISRLLFITPLGVFINNFYSSLTYLAIDIPFSKFIYEESKKKKDIADYFLFREFNLDIGRIAILLVAIFTGSIYWVFILSFFVTYAYSPLAR